MTDPGRPVETAFFPIPYAAEHADLLRQVQLAETLGYDLVAVQDHPYQRRFLDTFTLLPWLAANTERIRLLPDVAHLPLRPPAMMAKALASLDVLSGGRVELGLGAGGFTEASRAMGGAGLTGGAAVTALAEAITILRQFWSAPERGLRYEGDHYRLDGVKAGPPPRHDIGIWVGGAGPRMLGVIGRMADGWIAPGISYQTRDDLLAMQQTLDQAAADAGRDPAEIRRVAGIQGEITDGPAEGWFKGPADHWTEELQGLIANGFDTFIFWPPDYTDDAQLHAFAEVAAKLR